MLKNLLYFMTSWDHVYSSTATFLVCHPPVTSMHSGSEAIYCKEFGGSDLQVVTQVKGREE